jgi:hypothetical protein
VAHAKSHRATRNGIENELSSLEMLKFMCANCPLLIASTASEICRHETERISTNPINHCHTHRIKSRLGNVERVRVLRVKTKNEAGPLALPEVASSLQSSCTYAINLIKVTLTQRRLPSFLTSKPKTSATGAACPLLAPPQLLPGA